MKYIIKIEQLHEDGSRSRFVSHDDLKMGAKQNADGFEVCVDGFILVGVDRSYADHTSKGAMITQDVAVCDIEASADMIVIALRDALADAEKAEKALMGVDDGDGADAGADAGAGDDAVVGADAGVGAMARMRLERASRSAMKG